MMMEELEKWLEKKNQNIKDMKQEVLLEAHGYNTGIGTTWWKRNYLKIILYGFLSSSLIICYLLGFSWPVRIIGLMLILKGVSILWNLIKKGWTLITTYYQMKKLLKQASGLKRQ